MVTSLMRLVGVDLRQQLARLKAQAEDFKNHAIDEVKNQAIATGITVALVVGGLVFVLLTLVPGLIAIFLWVEPHRGPFAALGAVGATTALLAALLFVVAASRKEGGREGSTEGGKAGRAAPARPVELNVGRPASVTGQTLDDVTQKLTSRAAEATNEALDTAADLVRKSPREAILATLAVAVVVGLFVGRRRSLPSGPEPQ